jgi:hypothetical protein
MNLVSVEIEKDRELLLRDMSKKERRGFLDVWKIAEREQKRRTLEGGFHRTHAMVLRKRPVKEVRILSRRSNFVPGDSS